MCAVEMIIEKKLTFREMKLKIVWHRQTYVITCSACDVPLTTLFIFGTVAMCCNGHLVGRRSMIWRSHRLDLTL